MEELSIESLGVDVLLSDPVAHIPHIPVLMAPEKRGFGIHPEIIRSLIREQSSTLEKAIAELVMNSVDAGATRIDLEIDRNGFTLTDNGRGFGSRNEIERVFEVFGTPHEQGDAEYGRFRVGRGQIMAHAAVVWRSGAYHMDVDLGHADAELAYTLSTLAELQAGCVVAAKFYHPLSDYKWNNHWAQPQRTCLSELIQYIKTPVYVNGVKVSRDPSEEKWDVEDDLAWYRFSRNSWDVAIYDRGLRISHSVPNIFCGRGALVVTKQALMLNMARNEINQQCMVWEGIRRSVRAAFDVRLQSTTKFTPHEAHNLLKGLVKGDLLPTSASAERIGKNRFIEDVFGTFHTAKKMLAGDAKYGESVVFTCYDRKYSMTAERVHRDQLAIILPEWLVSCCNLALEPNHHEHDVDLCRDAIDKLRKALHYNGEVKWASLGYFARQLGNTHKQVPESALSEDEKLVLKALRGMNQRFSSNFQRKIVVGESDTMQAWTDGFSFIALRRDSLTWMRLAGGAGRLMALLMHEYSHAKPSQEDHAHDLAFFERFHSLQHSKFTHEQADHLFRSYARGVARLQIQPSGPLRYHVGQMGALQTKLKLKRGTDN